ncbi:MAG TPA: hypothetical protein V6C91_11005 [Coleofasciculaceae cyanobacterium]
MKDFFFPAVLFLALMPVCSTMAQSSVPTSETFSHPLENQNTSAPDFLNPNVNPFNLPTSTEQVQIQTTQPITLQQALDLATRNKQSLEVERLILQRQRAALDQAVAEKSPTLTFGRDVILRDSVSFP